MSIERTQLTRVFESGGVRLADPNPTLSVQAAVQLIVAAGRPDLATAEIRGPEQRGGEVVYTLHRAVGAKGAETAPVQLSPAVEKRLKQLEGQAIVMMAPDLTGPLKKLSGNQGRHALGFPSRDIPWLG